MWVNILYSSKQDIEALYCNNEKWCHGREWHLICFAQRMESGKQSPNFVNFSWAQESIPLTYAAWRVRYEK